MEVGLSIKSILEEHMMVFLACWVVIEVVRYGFYFVYILMVNILVNRMEYVQDRQYQHLFYLHKQKGGVFIP